ncbi:MAG: fibronectin type III domain-containing protein [Candidatus Limnocylindrales bacterium]
MYTVPERSLSRRLLLIGAVIALAVLPAGTTSRAAHQISSNGATMVPAGLEIAIQGAGVPPATSSFYVYGSYIDVCGLSSTTDCPLYSYGATETVPPTGGMTILDFGAPCFEPATLAWGTQLFNSQSCTPDAALVVLAQAWLRGFQANPNRAASTAYALAAGTSNSLTAAVPGYALAAAQLAAHGQAWFSSVVSPIAAVARSLATPVTIWAGNDIEESSDGSWYDGPTTAAWVDAYAAASGASKPCVAGRDALMVDYGDYVPNQLGWSVGAVYHVAWGSPAACPVPEIYRPVMAVEWQGINAWAQSVGLPRMEFTGVLSEGGAAGTLTALDSWNALVNASGQAAPYLSVVTTTGPIPPEVPDAPAAVTAVAGPELVMVSWSAPAWDGGAGVSSYAVAVYAGSVLVQTVTVSGLPVPESTIVTGLTNGTSYTFYVRAVNRVGTGPPSLPSARVVPGGSFLVR